MYIKYPLFGHTSHHVRTLMITLPVDAAIPYPHLPFFSFFGGRDTVSILHTLSYRGSSIVILLLDTMYPCVDYREGECYTQLWLPWIPRNPPLWIPVPPVCLPFSGVRFTTWTYPSHSLTGIWFNACCIASHTALCYTHILIILK